MIIYGSIGLTCFLLGVVFCRVYQGIYSKVKIKPTGWLMSILVGKETQYVGIVPKGRSKFLEVKKTVRRMYPVLTTSPPEKPPDVIGIHKTKTVTAGIFRKTGG